ncbi:MAG TPA: zf-HC2 domain-containing protein [Polyangiaceae bacterium]|jgi:anti-sigma factor (TIGR02949 family)|nr:zf-HC2 domain-containing protein [Polyangiaceae bacterium]
MNDCDQAREHLLDAVRGRLAEPEAARVERHLATCPECSRIFERERALEQALAKRTTYALPEALRERLAARVAPPPARRRLARSAAIFGPSLAALLLGLFLVQRWWSPNQELVSEAVNDHLRVLYAEHPIEIESGGIHQVKPWFAGRLDFAPVLSFSGDEEFPLEGGAIGLFVDRKAATFIFRHKLHTITLFVFRSEGLSWPLRGNAALGALSCTSTRARGFNTLLWRDGDLGYALVSDMDASELTRLGLKISSH